MTDKSAERIRMLVKVSTLYYVDELNQQEIAERLGISRPQVSRMLSAAKSEGIVQITIKNPFSEEQEYERIIMETFGIKHVAIIHVPGADQQLTELYLARAGAALLESVLKDHDIIGVMAGRSVAAVGAELNFFTRKNLQFVPLVGGWGAEGATWHSNSNVRVFGESLKSKYFLLNAPAIVASKQTRDLILQEQEIAEVMQLAKKATVALIGIGQVTEEATIVKSGYFTQKDIEEIRAKGAVANVCTSFLDRNGEVIPYEEESRMIGLSAVDLKNIETVVAFAHGKEKVPAIGSALRGGWMDVLVTDLLTAKQIISWHISTGSCEGFGKMGVE